MSHQETAIIIDDNEEITKLLTEILNVLGFKVVGIGYNGNDAIRLFETLNPEVIIMDVMMPEVDGHEALREIRKKSSVVKIIMMTGFASTGLEKCLEDDGANALVFKPFSIQKMKEVTEKIKNQTIFQTQ